METFLTIYLSATAAVLTATLIVEGINARRRAKRLQGTRDLLKAFEEARESRKPRPKRERGNGEGYYL